MRQSWKGALVAAAVFATALAAPGVAPAQQQGAAAGFTEAQKAEFAGILREALRADPSILREALEALEAAERRDREGTSRTAIAAHAEALFRNPADPNIGNPRGAVTVVEFFDPRCGYCKRMRPVVEELLRRQRDVRWVVKELPILGPNSVLASRALVAAQKQGKYAELHDVLLKLREEPTEPVLRREAERVGLDWARVKRDMDDPAVQRRFDATAQLAQALGVQGTPAMVVGETLVPGAVELAALERLVAEARGTAASAR
jgi:protein-disulfide isomerase